MQVVSEDSFSIIIEFKNQEEIKTITNDLKKHQYHIENRYNQITIFKDTLNFKMCF